jgi:hypothetical protein
VLPLVYKRVRLQWKKQAELSSNSFLSSKCSLAQQQITAHRRADKVQGHNLLPLRTTHSNPPSNTLPVPCEKCWNLIRGSLVPSILPEFYSRTDRGGSSNLVPEPRSWVQSPSTIFRCANSTPTSEKSIWWGSRSTDQWTPHAQAVGPDWHVVGGILEPDKRPFTPSISSVFYSRTGKGSSNMISELGGLEFKPRSRIPLHVFIPVYGSPYGGAHVAHTGGGVVLTDM